MTLRPWKQGLQGVVLVFFCYLAFCEFFFITHAMNGVFRSAASLVFIPAARIDGQSVSYKKVIELAHGMRGFANISDKSEAFDEALQVSVYRLAINKLADELDVTVSDDELVAYPVSAADIASGLETAKWDEQDYRKYIVMPLLLAQKTETAVSGNDTYQAEALDTMESLRKKLAQGMPLADVAQNFSQDPSALSRGDLGIMSMAVLPNWMQPAVTLEVGDISGVLSAPDAYWTLTLIEFFPSAVPEQAAIHFRGIAVKKKSFGAIVGDVRAENSPLVFVW